MHLQAMMLIWLCFIAILNLSTSNQIATQRKETPFFFIIINLIYYPRQFKRSI